MRETSRTAYTRLSEHLANYRAAAAAKLSPVPPNDSGGRARGRHKSWMWEHVRNYYDGVVGYSNGVMDFNVKVSGKFKRCLERQVNEDIRRQHCEAEWGSVLSRHK
jgi:hypothetical protein